MGIKRVFILLIVLFGCMVNIASASSEPVVNAVVSSNKVSGDDILKFQIQIECDTDDVVSPDLSQLAGFRSTFLGQSGGSSTQITSINGQMKQVTRNFVYLTYDLLPLKTGNLEIPSLSLKIAGKEYQTKPIYVTVSKAEQQQDFSFMEYKIPSGEVFLGETVPVEVVWYFRNNPRLDYIDVPLFDDSRFMVSKINTPAQPGSNERFLELILNNSKYWAIQSETLVNGMAYATLTMKWYITPKEAGVLELPASSVTASYVTGYRENSMMRGMPRGFSDVFGNDPFFSGREPVLKKMITRTEPAVMNVKPLPVTGRPDNFSGVVSQIKLGAKASTATASVGEPVAVELYVSGSDNIYNMTLPDFNQQSDIKDMFKVSVDKNDDTIVGDMRRFKLIFRPLTAAVKAIPPLKIAYYDPKSSNYLQAKTWEIPLTVKAAKIVTASDIESDSAPAAAVVSLKENQEGICENVYDCSALVNQNITVGKYLADNKVFFSVFPGCYFALLLGQVVLRKRQENAGGRAAGKALKLFTANINTLAKHEVKADNLTGAIIEYYKLKFQISEKELTLSDIYHELAGLSCLEVNTLENFRKITEYCEACTYMGVHDQLMSREFVESVKAVMTRIDNELG